MQLLLLGLLIGVAVGAAAGFMLRAHMHTVAADAASAVTRASTVSSGDVAALNAKLDGLGTAVQGVAAAVQKPANAAVDVTAAAAAKV